LAAFAKGTALGPYLGTDLSIHPNRIASGFGKDLFFPFPYWSSQCNYFTAILGVKIF
jgi:hypothetical protein